jgi:hypothetical protein
LELDPLGKPEAFFALLEFGKVLGVGNPPLIY